MQPEITIGMASHPPRRAGLASIAGLLAQAPTAHLYLYLNNYVERPPELPDDPRLHVTLAGGSHPNPDLGSHGNLVQLGKHDGYFLTVDDDIVYPSNYIATIIDGINRYGGRAIVGYHGTIYNSQDGVLHRIGNKIPRRLFHFAHGLARDYPVHSLGGSTTGCVPKFLGIRFEDISVVLHSGESEDMAILAQKRGIPLMCLKRERDWLKQDWSVDAIDALNRRIHYRRLASAKLVAYSPWRLIDARQ